MDWTSLIESFSSAFTVDIVDFNFTDYRVLITNHILSLNGKEAMEGFD